MEAVTPRLWAYEIRNSVLKGIQRKRITQEGGEIFLELLSDLRINLRDPLIYNDVFKLAGRYGLTVYDAAYLDLALPEGLPIASLDQKMNTAAAKLGVVLFQL